VAKDLENLKWENEVLELRFEKVRSLDISGHSNTSHKSGEAKTHEKRGNNIPFFEAVSIREGRVAVQIRLSHTGVAAENGLEKRAFGKEIGGAVRSVGATRDERKMQRCIDGRTVIIGQGGNDEGRREIAGTRIV